MRTQGAGIRKDKNKIQFDIEEIDEESKGG